MSGTNLLVVILSLAVGSITIAVTTTVTTDTSIVMNEAVTTQIPVEGDFILEDCELNCDLHYSGTISVGLSQEEANAPIKIESSFEMDSIDLNI